MRKRLQYFWEKTWEKGIRATERQSDRELRIRSEELGICEWWKVKTENWELWEIIPFFKGERLQKQTRGFSKSSLSSRKLSPMTMVWLKAFNKWWVVSGRWEVRITVFGLNYVMLGKVLKNPPVNKVNIPSERLSKNSKFAEKLIFICL